MKVNQVYNKNALISGEIMICCNKYSNFYFLNYKYVFYTSIPPITKSPITRFMTSSMSIEPPPSLTVVLDYNNDKLVMFYLVKNVENPSKLCFWISEVGTVHCHDVFSEVHEAAEFQNIFLKI